MNDTMSLLLATTILAAGGLGLYMYKSTDGNKKGGKYEDDVYDEEETNEVNYNYPVGTGLSAVRNLNELCNK